MPSRMKVGAGGVLIVATSCGGNIIGSNEICGQGTHDNAGTCVANDSSAQPRADSGGQDAGLDHDAASHDDAGVKSDAAAADSPPTSLEPRIHRLALEREHPEHALVNAPQRLLPHKPLEPLDAERELPQRERALCGQTA